MTDQQWETLRGVIAGDVPKPQPAGFIIDCPWLPNWYGVRILDYFTSGQVWLQANLKALAEFPDVMFFPGFWSEFGMCTEPSAFGARCTFPPDAFPHAHSLSGLSESMDALPEPDPRTDGLLPFVLNRLKQAQPEIERHGHRIRFAVARGPLNIASYLMGTTEFLTAIMLEPEKAEKLLAKITAFLETWLQVQKEAFPSIDGVFLLDDIIGFLGPTQFRRFALPLFKKLFALDVSVKFLHNDAPCRVSAPFLAEMGVNLFNMGFEVTLNELRQLTGDRVVLLGNIPPRDVLANGSPADVTRAAAGLLDSLQDRSRIIPSCGGGMPPGVSSANITAFVRTVRER